MRNQCQFTVKWLRADNISRFAVRCRSSGGDNPIGSRLERGTPMPVVKESYESEQEAQIVYRQASKHTQMNMKAREGQAGVVNVVEQPTSLIIRD